MRTINWQIMDEKDIKNLYEKQFDLKLKEINLEVIEELANCYENLANEADVSKRFDIRIDNTVGFNCLDIPALRLEFSVFIDQLEKHGQIHSLQAQNYVYVGKKFKAA